MSLFDSASLVVTPSGYKEDKLYSIKPTDGSGDLVVTRATTATRVNSAGLVELVPYNLLQYSQDYSNAIWTKSGSPTMTYNSAIAPDGTMTASGIKSNDATNYKSILQSAGSISANSTFTYSIYVKKETSETFFGGISVYLSGGTAKVFYGIVNAVNGTITNAASSTITPTMQVIDFGTYWRIVATATDTGSNTSILVEYYATFSQNGTSLAMGIGSVRTIWGAQLVTGSSAKEYFPTTDRLNVPRLDYTNSSCPSILVEPQRTNLALYSQQFDNAAWDKFGTALTVTSNNVVSPDGTQNADTLNVSNNNNTLYQVRTGTFVGNTYTFSIYAKGSGTFVMNGRLNSITTTTSTKTLTSQWQRFEVSVTNSSPVIAIEFFLDLNTSSTYNVWGAQIEAGSYATSYIPTVASSVTRNADVISKTGISSLIGQTEGTFFVEFNYNSINDGTTSRKIISLNDGSSTNLIDAYIQQGATSLQARLRNGGVGIGAITSGALSSGNYKLAYAYKNSDFVLYINGTQIGAVSSGTISFTSPVEIVQIGDGESAGDQLGGLIKSTVLWKTRLSNTELASLTSL